MIFNTREMLDSNDGLEDVLLCDGVERRCGLVTKHDGGVLENGPCNGNALLLAACKQCQCARSTHWPFEAI